MLQSCLDSATGNSNAGDVLESNPLSYSMKKWPSTVGYIALFAINTCSSVMCQTPRYNLVYKVI